MRNEAHRKLAMEAYRAFEAKSIDLDIRSYQLSSLGDQGAIPVLPRERTVYVLRLDTTRKLDSTVLAIPNRNDDFNVLYIGGHSSKNTVRYNDLIKACRKAEQFYEQHGYAENDKRHGHSVAGCLTTSLLDTGFRIKDCIIDVLCGGTKYDELEFIIGYEEKFHQVPPWNTMRGGYSAFPYTD